MYKTYTAGFTIFHRASLILPENYVWVNLILISFPRILLGDFVAESMVFSF